MGFFAYKAFDRSGESTKGVIEAATLEEAVRKLRDSRLYPVKIEPVGKAQARRRIPDEVIISFCKDLADLILAGLAVDRALNLLTNQETHPSFKSVLNDMARSVQEGKALSDAIEHNQDVFGALVGHMVRAGEVSGALEPVLRRLAEYLDRRRAFKQSLVSASIYPLLLLGMSLLSMIVLLIYVIPKFAKIFEDLQQSIPFVTRLFLAIGAGLENYGWVIPLILIGIFYSIRRITLSPEGKRHLDKWLIRLPLVRRLIIYTDLSRFFLAMGTMVRAGVPLLRAIIIAKNVVNNTVLKAELAPLYDSVKVGRPVSSIFAGKEIFPPRIAPMLRVGEEKGELGDTLLALGSYFEGETEKVLRRLMTLIEPIVIIGTGIIIGTMVLSMFSAIISISDIRF
ncbi:MAG: type II secretion system F family protein [Syntrophobacterales bacterium]|nr:type II secretion system F family protein [Syntrophobacterales bacterium]